MQARKLEYEGKLYTVRGLKNPARSQLDAAFQQAAEGDLRGIILEPDDLYIADAAFYSHTDLAQEHHTGDWQEVVRVILLPDSIYVEIYEKDDGSDHPESAKPPPIRGLQAVRGSEALARLYPEGTPVKVRSFTADYGDSVAQDFTL